jgi:hypothetical protein
MGYRVGKIHPMKKEKGTKVVGRNLLKDSECGYICFSRLGKWNMEKYPSQYKYANLLVGNEFFGVEKITEIKRLGTEPTLDLQVEDSHNFIANGYVVHNTGGQRSSSTPLGAAASTDPAGKKRPGKQEFKKNLTRIAAAHGIPYVAQASVSNLPDLTMKAEKAFKTKGPAVLVVLSTCPTIWGTLPAKTIDMAKMAVESRSWPLYEVENGKYRLTYKPTKDVKLEEFLKPQRRFRHLFMPGNEHMIEKMQKFVDEEWKKLLDLCGEKA